MILIRPSTTGSRFPSAALRQILPDYRFVAPCLYDFVNLALLSRLFFSHFQEGAIRFRYQ